MSAGIQSRVAAIQARSCAAALASGRDPSSVTLLAASKRHSVQSIREAHAAGVVVFGENYVQELVGKATELPEVEWHFIGHLQRNKVKQLAPHISMLHTLDSARLARALNQHAPMAVLIQINIGQEATKAGVHPADALALARLVTNECENLDLRGLMTIPPADGEPERWYAAMALLRGELSITLGIPLPELSMGMSGDLEQAIAHGSTIVRVGRAIFGARSV